MSRWNLDQIRVAVVALAAAMISAMVGPYSEVSAEPAMSPFDPRYGVVDVLMAPDGTLGILSERRDLRPEVILTTVDDELNVTSRTAGLLPYWAYASFDLGYSSERDEWLVAMGTEADVRVLAFRADGSVERTQPIGMREARTRLAVFDDPFDPTHVFVSSQELSDEEVRSTLRIYPLTLGSLGLESPVVETADEPFQFASSVRLDSGELLVVVFNLFGGVAEVRRYGSDFFAYSVVSITLSPRIGQTRLPELVRHADQFVLVDHESPWPVAAVFDSDGAAVPRRLPAAVGVPLENDPFVAMHLTVDGEGDVVAASLFDMADPLYRQRLALGDFSPGPQPDSLFAAAYVGSSLILVGGNGSVAAASVVDWPRAPLVGFDPPAAPASAALSRPEFAIGKALTLHSSPMTTTGLDDVLLTTVRGEFAWLDAACRFGSRFRSQHELASSDWTDRASAGVQRAVPISSTPGQFVVSDGGDFRVIEVPGNSSLLVASGDPNQPSLVSWWDGEAMSLVLVDDRGRLVAGPVEIATAEPADDAVHDIHRGRFVLASAQDLIVVDGHDLSVVARWTEPFPVHVSTVAVSVDPATGVIGAAGGGSMTGSTWMARFDPEGVVPDVAFQIFGMNANSVAVASDGPNGRFLIAAEHLYDGYVGMYDLMVEPTGMSREGTQIARVPVERPRSGLWLAYSATDGSGVVATGNTLTPFAFDGPAPTCVAPDEDAEVTLVATAGLPAGGAVVAVEEPVPQMSLGDPRDPYGYWIASSAGVAGLGNAPGLYREHSLVGHRVAPHPGGEGYWTLTHFGYVTAYGVAQHLGDPGLGAIELLPSATGDGYLAVYRSGEIRAFGDAVHWGDLPSLGIDPGLIVDAVMTPDGQGYWLVGHDGGVFAFGSASFLGSLPQFVAVENLAAPIVSMAVSPTGIGYWLIGQDGGVFAFGDAQFRGSIPGLLGGNALVEGIVAADDIGGGYLLLGGDGGVFNFSDEVFLGSLAGFGLGATDLVVRPGT
ncbi:MAG: hypothetical protein KDB16_15225 [Acidimicrobiales bacterium]|nr:hypothetical protein [Acidimicrobiales bacterium]